MLTVRQYLNSRPRGKRKQPVSQHDFDLLVQELAEDMAGAPDAREIAKSWVSQDYVVKRVRPPIAA